MSRKTFECLQELENGDQCEGEIAVTFTIHGGYPATMYEPGEPTHVEVEEVLSCTECGRLLTDDQAEEFILEDERERGDDDGPFDTLREKEEFYS